MVITKHSFTAVVTGLHRAEGSRLRGPPAGRHHQVIRQLCGNDWLVLSCHHGYEAVRIARTTTLLERGSGLYSFAGTPFPVLPYFEREELFVWLSFTKRPSSASMN